MNIGPNTNDEKDYITITQKANEVRTTSVHVSSKDEKPRGRTETETEGETEKRELPLFDLERVTARWLD